MSEERDMEIINETQEKELEESFLEAFESDVEKAELPDGIKPDDLKKKLNKPNFFLKYSRRIAGAAAACFLVALLGFSAYTGLNGKTLSDNNAAKTEAGAVAPEMQVAMEDVDDSLSKASDTETPDAGVPAGAQAVEGVIAENEADESVDVTNDAVSAAGAAAGNAGDTDTGNGVAAIASDAGVGVSSVTNSLPEGLITFDSYKAIYDYCNENDMINIYSAANNRDMTCIEDLDYDVDDAASEEKSIASFDGGVAANAESAAGMGGGDYSGTNVRTEGIDEADIVKTDGKYIYRVFTESGLHVRVVKAVGGKLKYVGDIMIENGNEPNTTYYASDMFVNSGKLVVVGTKYTYDDVYYPDYGTDYIPRLSYLWNRNEKTCLWVYDISEPTAPVFLAKHEQDGYFESARLKDGYLYTFSYEYAQPIYIYQPVYEINGSVEDDKDKAKDTAKDVEETEVEFTDYESLVPEVDGKSIPAGRIYTDKGQRSLCYSVATSLKIDSPAALIDQAAFMTDYTESYVSHENIFFWRTDYDYSDHMNANIDYAKTFIMKYSYKNGFMTPAATGSVKGYLNDSFSIDEYNGNLRMVTTDVKDFDEWREINQLRVLDENLNVIGRIDELAEDELIRSARFFGDTGYFVTFRQTDPLFSVDLSDPKNPKVIGKLKVSGFSEYLHGYGDGLLLGLGQEADETDGGTTGLKLSMFDVSDPSNVTEADRLMPVKNKSTYDYSSSEAEYDYKAILADPNKNLIGFYINGSQAQIQDDYVDFKSIKRYVVYGYDKNDGFFERFSYDYDEDTWPWDVRGLYIREYYYIVSGEDIVCVDMSSGEMTDRLKFKGLEMIELKSDTASKEKKYVAITVDDGPDGAGCKEYLSIAKENDIKLTFFVIGKNIANQAKQISDMLKAGCEIGNHSMTHPYLNNMSAEEIKEEIEGCDRAIEFAAPGTKVSFARAPYFAYSDTLYETVGYPLIESAVNEGDSEDEETTKTRLLSLKDGDIMLMHCWNEGSKKALKELVPQMIEDGYEFVTVSELFEIKGVTPEKGVVYKNVG